MLLPIQVFLIMLTICAAMPDLHVARGRRSIVGAVRRMLVGLQAKNKLLKDSRFDPAGLGSNQREFKKRGDYFTAVDDFFSVNPSQVRDYKLPGGTEEMVGRVGDRVIMIRKSAVNNNGSLRIQRDGSKDYIIRYKN